MLYMTRQLEGIREEFRGEGGERLWWFKNNINVNNISFIK